MSLIKFVDRRNGGERGDLHWGRALIDGAPMRFSGPPPLLKEHEFDERTRKVYDTTVKVFTDLAAPEQLEEYQEIVDGCMNGLYTVIRHKEVYDRRRGKWTAFLVFALPTIEPIPNGIKT